MPTFTTEKIVNKNLNTALGAAHLASGLGVLNLQGVWSRYEDAEKILKQISSVSKEEYVPLMQKVYQEPINKGRNRVEQRTVEVYTSPQFTHPEKWQDVEAVVQVDRHREVFDTKAKCWKMSDETAFYISTTVVSAEEFCQVIRGHWGIENRNHYVKDVSMGEDRSRIRINPHIFAKLRSFALNILRINHVKNVQLELFENCMNLDHVLNYVGVT